jgi:hypothetical protein
MAASGCDGMADTWMRPCRVQLIGFMLPYVCAAVHSTTALPAGPGWKRPGAHGLRPAARYERITREPRR